MMWIAIRVCWILCRDYERLEYDLIKSFNIYLKFILFLRSLKIANKKHFVPLYQVSRSLM